MEQINPRNMKKALIYEAEYCPAGHRTGEVITGEYKDFITGEIKPDPWTGEKCEYEEVYTHCPHCESLVSDQENVPESYLLVHTIVTCPECKKRFYIAGWG